MATHTIPYPKKQTVTYTIRHDDGDEVYVMGFKDHPAMKFSDLEHLDSEQFSGSSSNREDFIWEGLTSSASRIYGLDSRESLFDEGEIWDMNNFTIHHSILNSVDAKSYINVGMTGTWFCIHCEDSDAASVNYLHSGQPKWWYCVSAEEAPKLEKLLNSLIASAKFKCRTVVRHKCFLVRPSLLKKHGIKFTRVQQNPGDFIFTLYGAYHWGFNAGINICESSNLASPRYEEFHKKAVLCQGDCR